MKLIVFLTAGLGSSAYYQHQRRKKDRQMHRQVGHQSARRFESSPHSPSSCYSSSCSGIHRQGHFAFFICLLGLSHLFRPLVGSESFFRLSSLLGSMWRSSSLACAVRSCQRLTGRGFKLWHRPDVTMREYASDVFSSLCRFF